MTVDGQKMSTASESKQAIPKKRDPVKDEALLSLSPIYLTETLFETKIILPRKSRFEANGNS
jgi:hypothetical protein